jgi:CRISPR/Cas system-associated protein Cas5 (RAMP superfamily)
MREKSSSTRYAVEEAIRLSKVRGFTWEAGARAMNVVSWEEIAREMRRRRAPDHETIER